MSEVRELDIKVDPVDANPGVKNLITVIRPDWKWESVNVAIRFITCIIPLPLIMHSHVTHIN